ncbi:MAG: hypothetical protein ACOC2B_05750, partial [Sediminispirochaetaceae bacterium]
KNGSVETVDMEVPPNMDSSSRVPIRLRSAARETAKIAFGNFLNIIRGGNSFFGGDRRRI